MKASEQDLYRRIKLLGEGSFGKAYLVECIIDKSLCVIKQVDLTQMKEEERRETIKEARILEALRHPNIVKFREVYKTKKGRLCIVMDYADGGDMSQKLKEAEVQKTPISEIQILDWFTQLCLALKHVHDRKIIHRDLKTQNIFLTKDGIIKMGDFGIARVLNHTREKCKTMVGTPYYLSPEIIDSRDYSFKTDIWSLGVILYEMCALKPPFNAESLHGLALKIVRGQYSPIPERYSGDVKNLIKTLLNVDPQRRPTIHEVLRMPVIVNRIRSVLSESVRKLEFSHTILHKQNFVKNNLIVPYDDDLVRQKNQVHSQPIIKAYNNAPYQQYNQPSQQQLQIDKQRQQQGMPMNVDYNQQPQYGVYPASYLPQPQIQNRYLPYQDRYNIIGKQNDVSPMRANYLGGQKEYQDKEREKEKERDIQRDREKEKEKEQVREKEKEREREREKDKEKEKEKEREKDKERERDKEREKERNKSPLEKQVYMARYAINNKKIELPQIVQDNPNNRYGGLFKDPYGPKSPLQRIQEAHVQLQRIPSINSNIISKPQIIAEKVIIIPQVLQVVIQPSVIQNISPTHQSTPQQNEQVPRNKSQWYSEPTQDVVEDTRMKESHLILKEIRQDKRQGMDDDRKKMRKDIQCKRSTLRQQVNKENEEIDQLINLSNLNQNDCSIKSKNAWGSNEEEGEEIKIEDDAYKILAELEVIMNIAEDLQLSQVITEEAKDLLNVDVSDREDGQSFEEEDDDRLPKSQETQCELLRRILEEELGCEELEKQIKLIQNDTEKLFYQSCLRDDNQYGALVYQLEAMESMFINNLSELDTVF